ncbi:MAG: ABC transporter permease [Lachnospiraceae bacterium]|nr:ABC transporter permease [Lachnospiraceae bacterium]
MMIIEPIKYIINEHVTNRNMIMQLARENTKKETSRTSLGVFWIYFRDLIYFGVYIVFRFLMSGGGEIDGMNSIAFVLLGLISWFFISDVLNKGANAIKAYRGIIKSIKFPISTIPTISVFSIFYQRLVVFGVGFLIPVLFGYFNRMNILWGIYFCICNLIMMVSINLIFSAFVAISGDFHQLYMAISRILIYILPVIWSYSKIKDNIYLEFILKLNPMGYVITGFRDALALGKGPTVEYTIYFWGVTCLIFYFGCLVQFKLKKYFADFV